MKDSFREINADAALDRALRYPYELPKRSYLFDRGTEKPLSSDIDDHIKGKTAVLAYGSNAAVEALDRKFRDFDDLYNEPIPVLFGCMHDYMVAYSAQFSTYGALPATIAPFSGGLLQTYVTLLNDKQIQRMHDTEDLDLYYSYERIENTFEFNGKVLKDCYAYVALGGTLTHSGEPLALSAVEQRSRHPETKLNTITQKQAQQFAIELLSLDIPVEQFIVENALNKTLRDQRFRTLSDIAGDIWHK